MTSSGGTFWVLLAVAWLGLWTWFAIFTWRRIHLLTATEENEVVAHHGVRRFGYAIAGFMTLYMGLKDVHPLTIDAFGNMEVWLRLAISAFVSIPLGLWAGYGWGRTMSTFISKPRNRRDR